MSPLNCSDGLLGFDYVLSVRGEISYGLPCPPCQDEAGRCGSRPTFSTMHRTKVQSKGIYGGSTRTGWLRVWEALSLKLNWLVSFRSLGCLGVISSSSITVSATWKQRPRGSVVRGRWWEIRSRGGPGLGWRWKRECRHTCWNLQALNFHF